MNLHELTKVCAMNPVSTYLEQLEYGHIKSLNREIVVWGGHKKNLSDFLTNGDSKKIVFPIKKIDIARYYRADNKTLNKWVKAFCPKEFYAKWNMQNKKIVNENDFEILREYLGFSFLVANASKKLLAQTTKQKQHAIKVLMQDADVQIMDFETYKTIGKFPPRITEKLYLIIQEELS